MTGTSRIGRKAFHPGFMDLPRTVPVFPLSGALLLPGGHLPLNIFEPRYVAMVEDALGHGRMMAMVQPRQSEGGALARSNDVTLSVQPPNGPGDPTETPLSIDPDLYSVGCLGRIVSFSEADDGRFLITLIGVSRFHIGDEIEGHRGYRRFKANFGSFADDLNPPPDVLDVDVDDLFKTLRAYADANNLGFNWKALEDIPVASLITSLAMVCPFKPNEKQALLEAETLQDRAEHLLALAGMGAMSQSAGLSESMTRQ